MPWDFETPHMGGMLSSFTYMWYWSEPGQGHYRKESHLGCGGRGALL